MMVNLDEANPAELLSYEDSHHMDLAIIKTALEDLRSANPQDIESAEFITAALFVFPDGHGVDEGDPYSFTSICNRIGWDPNKIAKGIWKKMPHKNKAIVIQTLEDRGFNPKYSITKNYGSKNIVH